MAGGIRGQEIRRRRERRRKRRRQRLRELQQALQKGRTRPDRVRIAQEHRQKSGAGAGR
ncbi:MAG: hypothetical protein ACREQ9_25535 [Candidatus Binatia bacterium]